MRTQLNTQRKTHQGGSRLVVHGPRRNARFTRVHHITVCCMEHTGFAGHCCTCVTITKRSAQHAGSAASCHNPVMAWCHNLVMAWCHNPVMAWCRTARMTSRLRPAAALQKWDVWYHDQYTSPLWPAYTTRYNIGLAQYRIPRHNSPGTASQLAMQTPGITMHSCICVVQEVWSVHAP